MENIYILIGATGTICSIIFAYVGYQKGVKKDCYTSGTNTGNLASDINYIKRRTDDVLLEQKDTNKSLNVLSERVTRVEESTKSAHKRLDQIEQEGK